VNSGQNQIVFYDGDCGFCNRSVAYILRHEKEPVLHFASLQSAFAKDFFDQHDQVPSLETFYLAKDGVLYEKSTAALKLGKYLKFPGNLLGLLIIVPRKIRDWFYSGIAKRRHRVYAGYCLLLNQGQRRRFFKD